MFGDSSYKMFIFYKPADLVTVKGIYQSTAHITSRNNSNITIWRKKYFCRIMIGYVAKNSI